MDDYRARMYAAYPIGPGRGTGAEAVLRQRAPYLRKLIREHFPADRQAVILDAGCGAGALLHFAREGGYSRIRGIDRSAPQVAAGRAVGLDVEQGDALQVLPRLENDSHDLVIAFDVLEHCTKDEVFALLQEVSRILKPGGALIAHVPNGESPFVGRVRYGDFTHETAFTRTSLEHVLRVSGFGDVRCYEDQPVPHGVLSAARFVLWRCIRLLLRLYLIVETGPGDTAPIFSQNMLAVARKTARP